MAKSTILCAVLLLSILMEMNNSSGSWVAAYEDIDCPAKCEHRCSKASRHNMCMRACIACCHKCHCVPPGTYGHKEECPCYAHMKTHGGKPKCP